MDSQSEVVELKRTSKGHMINKAGEVLYINVTSGQGLEHLKAEFCNLRSATTRDDGSYHQGQPNHEVD